MTARGLAIALLLVAACDAEPVGSTGGAGGKADGFGTDGGLPDPNAAEPPPVDWQPPPLAEWPARYVIFNNPPCGRACGSADQQALKGRSVMVKMILAAIASAGAGETIRIANFNISSSSAVTPVFDALVAAMHDRGVTVKIAMDVGQDTATSRTSELARQGAQVSFSPGLTFDGFGGAPDVGILHSKMVIVGDRVLFTGSNNFSASGFVTNEENSVVLGAPEEADRIAAFTCDFEAMFAAGSPPGVGARSDDDPIRRAAIVGLDACNTADASFPPSGMLTTKKSRAYGVLVAAIGKAEASLAIAPDMLAHPGLVSAILRRAKQKAAASEPFAVRVVLDASPEAFGNPAFGDCLAQAAAAHGFAVEVRYWKGNEAIFQLMHHKFLIVDAAGADPVLYNGSANYSAKALKWSFENVSRYAGDEDRPLIGDFTTRFDRLFDATQSKADLEAAGVTVPSCPTDPESLL